MGRSCRPCFNPNGILLVATILLCCVDNSWGWIPICPSRTITRSSRKRLQSDLWAHEFWGAERTAAEIEAHVHESLPSTITLNGKDYSSQAATTETPTVVVLSAEPPLVLIHDFLSLPLCQAIIDMANHNDARLQPSQVGASQKRDSTRTSSTVWLTQEPPLEGPLMHMADAIATLSGVPASHQENLQVVRYQPGQEFQLHTDHQDEFNRLDPKMGRLATCLLYLESPTSGGATWFPNVLDEEMDIHCSAGSAVFFWNTLQRPGCDGYHPEMDLIADERLAHAGRVVKNGEKWVCNKWIHPVVFGAGVRGLDDSE